MRNWPGRMARAISGSVMRMRQVSRAIGMFSTTDAVRCTVEQVRRAGTLVIGLFVGSQGEIRYLQDIFGVDDTIGVADIRHLPDRLDRRGHAEHAVRLLR